MIPRHVIGTERAKYYLGNGEIGYAAMQKAKTQGPLSPAMKALIKAEQARTAVPARPVETAEKKAKGEGTRTTSAKAGAPHHEAADDVPQETSRPNALPPVVENMPTNRLHVEPSIMSPTQQKVQQEQKNLENAQKKGKGDKPPVETDIKEAEKMAKKTKDSETRFTRVNEIAGVLSLLALFAVASLIYCGKGQGD